MPAQPKLSDFSPLQSRAAALARPEFFRHPGRFQEIFFGEIPVGEGFAHHVVFDAEKNAAFCSCPFFPKPCLHARALIALAVQTDLFPETAQLPEWAEALRSGHFAPAKSPVSSPELRTQAVQKRRFERLERAAHGLEDLETWLLDTLRRGLATAVSEDAGFSGGIAARMADASMTALSRRLRLLENLPHNQPDWGEKTLSTLADAYLAVRAFRQRDQLPEPLLHDLQSFLGIPVRKEEALAAGESVADAWAVLGRREEPLENQLTVRRTWLLGARSGRQALLLDYAFGYNAGLPPGFSPGDIVEGTLVFYPSAYAQRALAQDDLRSLPKKVEKWPGYADFQAFAIAYAQALGLQPWLALFAAAFPAVTPVVEKGRFLLVDAAGQSLSLQGLVADGWKLLALSGGRPVGVFGEWDGAALRVLSVAAAGKLIVV